MKRQPPRHALKVAQLRCDAAVTITISGSAGSGKSTAAEIIARSLAANGYKTALLEADDSLVYQSNARGSRDDRTYLVMIEGSKIAFKPAVAEEDDEDDESGEDLPPILKAFLHGMVIKATRQGM